MITKEQLRQQNCHCVLMFYWFAAHTSRLIPVLIFLKDIKRHTCQKKDSFYWLQGCWLLSHFNGASRRKARCEGSQRNRCLYIVLLHMCMLDCLTVYLLSAPGVMQWCCWWRHTAKWPDRIPAGRPNRVANGNITLVNLYHELLQVRESS